MTDYVVKGIREAVKFIIEDERGRLLIEKRSKDAPTSPSVWAILAGHVDSKDLKSSDYRVAALKRECMEECNLVPNFIRYLCTSRHKSSGHQYRTFYYLCKGFDKSRIPKRNPDGGRFKWVNSAEARRLVQKHDKLALSKMPSKRAVIVVTGTPGTGKTVLAKELAQTLNFGYLGLSEAIKRYKLSEGFDRKKGCQIVSIRVLQTFLRRFLKDNPRSWVLDGHLSHFLPKSYVDLCVVTTTGLKTLKKRLEARKYSSEKVRENLDSEIFQVCLQEAREKGHKVLVLDSTRSNVSSLAVKVVKAL